MLQVERTISSRSTRIWVMSQPRRLPQRFGSSIGFKPGDFMTTGMNETANCVALPRFKQSDAPRASHAL